MNTFTLVSLNTERDKHVERWMPRMKELRPDVLLLQEFPPYLIERVRAEFGLPHYFYENTCFSNYEDAALMGVALFSRFPLLAVGSHLLGPRISTTRVPRVYTDVNTHLIVGALDIEGTHVHIGTTQLPVTKEGEVTERQMQIVRELLAAASVYTPLVFAGDFNAPRGRAAFATIAASYHDAIPAHHTTSIDGELHRAGPIPFMVDGLFHTEGVQVSDVELMNGLSDHLGIRARVSVG